VDETQGIEWYTFCSVRCGAGVSGDGLSGSQRESFHDGEQDPVSERLKRKGGGYWLTQLLLWFITSLSISHMSYFLACLEFLIQYQTFIQKKLQSPDGVILRKDCTLFLCQAECGAGPLHLTNSS
jgi:hypothetical protein